MVTHEDPVFTSGDSQERFGRLLLHVAREAVASYWDREPSRIPDCDEPGLSYPHPVFVTLWDAHGELRGCVGTLHPRTPTVGEETWRMAREAAFSDSRFPAVAPEEVPSLRFEISVVLPLEDVDDPETLDPRVDGVVVSTSDGRRGALLPDVEGIETVGKQLAIARRKGHIAPDEPVRIRCFRVVKFSE